MKVLLTGGEGSLGSHLADRLVAEGLQVAVLDPTGGSNFITTRPTVYRQDYRSNTLGRIFEKERPEMVCHFPRDRSLLHSCEHPLDNAEQATYSLNLLEQCKNHRVKRVIYCSSAAVYGHPQYLPCDEEHPTHPISPLGVTQRTVENYLYSYWVNFGLDHVVLRPANVYGPRAFLGIVSALIKRMLAGDKVIINGDGLQERDFLYFSDVTDAAMGAIRLPERRSKRAAPVDFIYNLGTGESISVNDLYHMVAEKLGYGKKPVQGPQLPCEVFEMGLDAHHAMTSLGWEPQVPLSQGLDKTIMWFKKRM